MAALGEAAEEQRPVLVNLSASARELEEFLDRSAELSEAARPALRELGETAQVGTPAARAAAPHVTELGRYAQPLVDLAPNLRIVLEDFSDPARAVEKDPRSPNGKGYSGAQALLRYVFSQSLVNNGFDALGYMVRAAVHTDHCSPFADAKKAREKTQEDCRSWLGPEPVRRHGARPDRWAEEEKSAKRRRRGKGTRQRAMRQRRRGPRAGLRTSRSALRTRGTAARRPARRAPRPDARHRPEDDLTPLLDYLLG